jgi:hypothetical protein
MGVMAKKRKSRISKYFWVIEADETTGKTFKENNKSSQYLFADVD